VSFSLHLQRPLRGQNSGITKDVLSAQVAKQRSTRPWCRLHLNFRKDTDVTWYLAERYSDSYRAGVIHTLPELLVQTNSHINILHRQINWKYLKAFSNCYDYSQQYRWWRNYISIGHWWNGSDRVKPEILGRNPSQCHTSVSQPPGRGPVPGINYTGPRESPGICHFSLLSNFHE